MRYSLLFLLLVFQLNAMLSQAQVKTIKIGNQIWMAENMDVDIKGSWVYDNNPANSETYGRLYNWQAANKVCPAGWHLPSDKEWAKLFEAFGGESEAGKQLKLEGSSGFKAPYGGYCNGKSFWFLLQYVGYWSSSSYDDGHAWLHFMTNKDNTVTTTYFNKNYGFSVRCVKD